MHLTISPHSTSKPPVIVVLKLGGGFDALYAVPPLHHGKTLHALRPTLNPDHFAYEFGSVRSTDLDGNFGIHPDLFELKKLFDAQKLGIVYGVGNPGASLSHFDAMKLLEQGGRTVGGFQSGWLGRYIRLRQKNDHGVIALSTSVKTEGLLIGCETMQLPHAKPPELITPNNWGSMFSAGLRKSYHQNEDASGRAGQRALQAIDKLGALARTKTEASYGATASANELAFVGKLINAELGLETAVLDFGGWDFHNKQAGMSKKLLHLSCCIDAFFEHISKNSDNVVLLTVSEFGRRAAENSAEGTDHGRGTLSFVVGDIIAGGKIHGEFQGLDPEHLDADGNIPVTTNYCDVFSQILRLGVDDEGKLAKIFRG